MADFTPVTASRIFRNRVFVWDRKFAKRQRLSYRAEDNKLNPEPHQNIIDAFFHELGSRLDPPPYKYSALRKFLEKANPDDLVGNNAVSGYSAPSVLLDDRRDDTGGHAIDGEQHSARDWDGYVAYPPLGSCQFTSLMTPRQLYQRRSASRNDAGAERRVMYIANLSPLCALAIISTAARLRAPILRDYFQRYLSNRVYFGVSMDFGYALEFHLPYYALRQRDALRVDPRGLRRSGPFLLVLEGSRKSEYLYEAQISFLITGVDEWLWTAYCCAETHFKSEETIKYYHENQLDALTGGEKSMMYPVWNPREYFLSILSRRLRQITKEWSNVIEAIQERLRLHDDGIFCEDDSETSLTDDKKFSRTRDYTATIDLLRLLYNSLVRIIESWERFADGEVQYFDIKDQKTLRKIWENYKASIEKDMTEIRFLKRVLNQNMETLKNKKDGLVNASTMVESRVATDQGDNIGRLTRVTVVFLPLSLGTAVFSMMIIPKGASWVAYALLLVFLTAATLIIMSWKFDYSRSKCPSVVRDLLNRIIE